MLNRWNNAVPTGLEMIRGNILFYPYFVPNGTVPLDKAKWQSKKKGIFIFKLFIFQKKFNQAFLTY
jgi:hypothetical protein